MKRSLLLSLILLIALPLAACAQSPRIPSDSNPTSSGETSPSGLIVDSAGQASIDFGALLEVGDEVTIEKVTPAPVDEDVEIYAYDFRLSSGQPDGAVEIIIPYDDQGLDSDEEHWSVCGKYYNEATTEWEDVFYTVDTDANTVHILTDHLSTYSVFKITNPQKRNAYISEVNVYAAYMTNDQAQAVLKAFSERSATWQADTIRAFLEATGGIEYFAATNLHALLTLGEAYDDWISQPFQNAMTGLGVSTACVQLAYDACHNGLRSPETTANAMKSALNMAINFATPSIKMAYVGVGVIDLALTDVQTYAVSQKYNSTKNMYDAYYRRPGIRRNHTDWRKRFESIYKENKDDPQAALDQMNAEIERYVGEYWEVADSDWLSWIEAYDKNGKLSKYPWPSKKDRENISAIHQANLYDDLHAVFNTIGRNMYFDSLIEREKEYQKLAAYYNREFSLVIQENTESDQPSTWAGCYARLAPLSASADSAAWTGRLNEEGGGTLTFTLLGHLNAGFPMTLELYRTSAAVQAGEKARSIRLEPFADYVQTVILQPREESDPVESEPEETEPSGTNPQETEPVESSTAETSTTVVEPPAAPENPWYDVTIQSADNTNPKAFSGWSAVLAYPENQSVDLDTMYRSFDNNGKCLLSFQESDHDALESPNKIWLYQNVADLLSGAKPNVIVSFSIGSGSYAGEYSGERLYTITVKAKPPASKSDILESISGDYTSYMARSEWFVPGEGLSQIDQKATYEPGEKPSGNVWLHYNGPSLTFKSYEDPNNTEYVLDKKSDSRYERIDKNGSTTVTRTVEIGSAGYSARYTFLKETEAGERQLQVFELTRK